MLLKEHSAPPRAPGGPVSSQPGSQCPVTRPEGRKAWGMTSTPNSPALDTPLHDLTPPGRDFTGGTQVLQVPLCYPAWAFLIPPHCPPVGPSKPSWPGEPFLAGRRPEIRRLWDRVPAPSPSSPPCHCALCLGGVLLFAYQALCLGQMAQLFPSARLQYNSRSTECLYLKFCGFLVLFFITFH